MQLPSPGTSVEQSIAGPAGRIEALLSAPREPAATPAFAVICHPHPLFGGAMSNKVVYTLASCAQKAGLYALRFNFRGVGRSEGVHDQGRGESDDVGTVVDWMHEHLPDAPVVLAGFSFGAWVSVQAAAHIRPVAQVSVAPPFSKYFDDAPLPPRPPCPWLVIHGSDDEVVDYRQTRQILERYDPPPELITLDDVGHFFHGRLDQLAAAVQPFLDAHVPGRRA